MNISEVIYLFHQGAAASIRGVVFGEIIICIETKIEGGGGMKKVGIFVSYVGILLTGDETAFLASFGIEY